MNFDDIKNLIDLNYSQREIAKKLGISQSTIRYWLLKFNIKTNYHPHNKNGSQKICSLCGNEIKNNYKNRSKCQSCTTRIRRYRTKMMAVEYLGGKCKKCGWTGNVAAFEFHHLDNNKDFNIGNASNKSWAYVVKELDKCELLCSNCHRIVHTKFDKDKIFMDAVMNYKKQKNSPQTKLAS